MKHPPRWAVFISGQGTNLQAILDLNDEAHVVLVVSSNPEAYGLTRAEKAGVPTLVLEKRCDWMKLHETLLERKVDAIFLAGFMKILPADFVSLWEGKIVNVHPSLLPKYPGTHGIERSYRDRSDMGVTIHVVTAELDAGPILVQKKVYSGHEIGGLTLEECEEAIHRTEHQLVREIVRSWR